MPNNYSSQRSNSVPEPSMAASFHLQLEAPLPRDLFSTQAEEAAERCASRADCNKSTQIRRFYDELVMWAEDVAKVPEAERSARFAEVEPYIQMIQAKAAYAFARKLVDESFLSLIKELISRIRTPESLENAKLFFEAFLGFKKFYEERG